MSTKTIETDFEALTSDPTSPVNGQLWIRDDTREVKLRSGGVTRIIARRDNLAGNGSPTVNDDVGDDYQVGSIWVDTTYQVTWVCTDNASAAAKWRPMTRFGVHDNQTSGATALTTTYASVASVGGLDELPAGTYKVIASLWCYQTSSSNDVEIGLSLDASTTIEARTYRLLRRGANQGAIRGCLAVTTLVTATEDQTIDLMAREQGGNGGQEVEPTITALLVGM